MKLSFSTCGWEHLSWENWLDLAKENGFSGIELHNPSNLQNLLKRGGPLHSLSLSATVRQLHEKQLSIPVLDSLLDLSDSSAENVRQIEDLMELAHGLSVPCISVIASSGALEEISTTLSPLLKKAEKNEVIILIRTSAMFAGTAQLRVLFDSFASDNLAALWDVHHTYRDGGETPAQTITNLGAYILHVHLHDSLDGITFALPGEGTLPIREVINALSSINYGRYVSLEWNPVWLKEIRDPDIIFPHFTNYMSRFDDSDYRQEHLYPNHDGTGQYVWEKYTLIPLTFSQVLARMVKEFPDQYCFKYTTLDYTRTYAQFQEDVINCAGALLALGVRPGSKVAVWATNVPEWFITFWAAAHIGAVLVSMNTAYKIHEAEYLLRKSDTHTLVMISSCRDCDYIGIINELCPEIASARSGKPLHCKKLPFLRNVITVGFRQKGLLTFDDMMVLGRSYPRREIRRYADMVKPNDVCNMQYTSGTTGFPKGVMLTHYNVINNGKCIGDRMGLSTADRMMIQVPMFHCFGMVLSMIASMTHGTTICPLPYFSARTSLACINQEKITCFNGVPTMFIAMFNHPDYRKTDFSHMRTGIMAGAGCPPELMRKAARPDEMNMRGIVSVYGQTESSPGSTMSAWTDSEEIRCDTVGYAFPHVECKIVDPATGETLPNGQNGEFCSRGYNLMKGYYKMPDATEETVDADGWLHSGDLACRDDNGCYRITGRLKDMIIRGGENIYPKEIEEFIYTHPAVADVQVIGVPDKRYGEEVMACIILKEGMEVSEEEMRSFITDSLARHKVPRYIRFVDSFPMNAAGKILKYKMREDAAKELGLSEK